MEFELSGDIDSSQETPSGDSKSSLLKGMSLPVPINLSQPAVKEWFGKRRANIRPFGVFFNTTNFQVSHSSLSPSVSDRQLCLGIVFSSCCSLYVVLGPSLSRETHQETVQECGVLPVQLRAGVLRAGPLLPHHLAPPHHRDRRHRGRLLHRRPQECREETVHSW